MEAIQDLINSIKTEYISDEDVKNDYYLYSLMHDEAILAFALRFLQSNLDDEEVAEALYDSLQ